MDPPLRDLYGLEINADYADLLDTYQPLWIKADVDQSRKWKEFLSIAAQELGLLQPDQCKNANEAVNGELIGEVLQVTLALGEQHAPELYGHLAELVIGGVPNDLRQYVWPALLRIEQRCPVVQYYSKVVALHKELVASITDGGGTPSGSKEMAQQDLHNMPPASPTAVEDSLPPLGSPAAVEAELLGIERDSLLLWRCHVRVWESQIGKDCHRTFPGHEWISGLEGQAALHRVLSCFCLVAPQLGYCQGMNFVVGALLLVFSGGWQQDRLKLHLEQQQQQQQQQSGGGLLASFTSRVSFGGRQRTSSSGSTISENKSGSVSASGDVSATPTATSTAAAAPASGAKQAASRAAASEGDFEGPEALAFGCLLAIAEDVLPGYYSPAMVAPQVDQRVLGHLISEHFPKLSQHLSGLGIEPALPLPGWLLSGFVTSGMPFETTARLWDVAFLERSAAPLVRACLGLFSWFGAAFLSSQDVIDASLLLQAMPGLAFDSDRLSMVAGEAYKEVTNAALQGAAGGGNEARGYSTPQPSLLTCAAGATGWAEALAEVGARAHQLRAQQPTPHVCRCYFVQALRHCFRAEVVAEMEARAQMRAAAIAEMEAVVMPGYETLPTDAESEHEDACSTPTAAAAAASKQQQQRQSSPDWVPDFDAPPQTTAGGAAALASSKAADSNATVQQQPQAKHGALVASYALSTLFSQDPEDSLMLDNSDDDETLDDAAAPGGRLPLTQQYSDGPQYYMQQQLRRLQRKSHSATAAAGVDSDGKVFRIMSDSSAMSGAVAQAFAAASSPGMLAGQELLVSAKQPEQRQQQRSPSRSDLGGGSGSSKDPTSAQQQQGDISKSSSSGKPLLCRSTEESDGEGGWMLLGATPPGKIAATKSTESAGLEPTTSGILSPTSAAAAAVVDPHDMAELREQYGLQAVQDAYRAAAVAAAEQEAQQSCCHEAGVLVRRYEDVIHMSLTCAEVLLAELAGKQSAIAAVNNQLARSMVRLAEQDAELANKDEEIEKLREQLKQAQAAVGGRPGSSASTAADGADAATTGRSSDSGNESSWKQRFMGLKRVKQPPAQQQQQSGSADGQQGSSSSTGGARCSDIGTATTTAAAADSSKESSGDGVQQEDTAAAAATNIQQQQQQQASVPLVKTVSIVLGGGKPHLPPAESEHLHAEGASYSQYVALVANESTEDDGA